MDWLGFWCGKAATQFEAGLFGPAGAWIPRLAGEGVRLEPVVGIEPTTDGLQNRSSTTELNWLGRNSLRTPADR